MDAWEALSKIWDAIPEHYIHADLEELFEIVRKALKQNEP